MLGSIISHDLKPLNSMLFPAGAWAITASFMSLFYKLFIRGTCLTDSWNKNTACTFMLQVYDDRLFLPQKWKLPKPVYKKKPVNKNSLHTEVHSFTEQPNLPNVCSIFQIKSEMLFFVIKYVYNKENYFRILTWSFLYIKINCRWLWFDQWNGFCLILRDTFVKTCKVATLQYN